MAKKYQQQQQPSETYQAQAHDALKGMAWFAGLAFFVFPHERLTAYGCLAVATILMVIGCVMYVFGHQASMLEAQDRANALPKEASAP